MPVIRFAAIFSGDPAIIDEAVGMAESCWGDRLCQSADILFDMTSFYTAAMGPGLIKRLVAFRELTDPAGLVASKCQSNDWESGIQSRHDGSLSRVVNIDPGYVTEAKVVLATMKDRDHRLYLGNGVFGEVTLYFQLPDRWVGSRWTYPDYLREEYHVFFAECRDYLRGCLQQRHLDV